ncbi:MAG: hypothetical protein EOO68_27815 [Moraxellaceae bacterium]|nr:MAG: hypothetical protein EOO68_27815 [Moraxellaceae bacterium]
MKRKHVRTRPLDSPAIWSEDDRARLRLLYPTTKPREIALLLGRTTYEVQKRAERMRLYTD